MTSPLVMRCRKLQLVLTSLYPQCTVERVKLWHNQSALPNAKTLVDSKQPTRTNPFVVSFGSDFVWLLRCAVFGM